MPKSLAEIVKNAIEGKNIKTTGFTWDRVRGIERGINSDMTSDKVIAELNKEKDFRLGLKRQDWESIKKDIKGNFRLRS